LSNCKVSGGIAAHVRSPVHRYSMATLGRLHGPESSDLGVFMTWFS
jgi:hypothetical protein